MNPEWAEIPAVMEIVKNRLSKALRLRQKNLKIRQSKIVLGKEDEERGEILPNKINLDEFELGDEERFVYSAETGTINYIRIKGKSSFEKREIDVKSGVVIRHLKKFGGNITDDKDENYYSLIEYTRDPKEPKVYCKIVNNNGINGERTENTISEYDYGYPDELEKNGTTHKKTPIYFIKRYPKYEQWFNQRFKSKEEYVKKVFEMQKKTMSSLVKDQRKCLETTIISFAKTKDKLDVYYKGLQEIFQTNVIGPVFKLFITGKIESIINNDELHMFYEMGSQEEMLDRIKSKLESEINSKPFEEIVKQAGAGVVTRIGENPDYQVAKQTFTGKAKTPKNDGEFEVALADIHQQSNLVTEFKNDDNPFQLERMRLEEKIANMKREIRILQAAYRAFPNKKKNIQSMIKKIENEKLDGNVLPTTPSTNGNQDGR